MGWTPFTRFCFTAALAVGLPLLVSGAPEPAALEGLFAAPDSDGANQAQNLGGAVNGAGSDFGPIITADGNWLYFTSNRPGGQGGQDFWVSERVEGFWQPARNLGAPVNTPGDEGPDSFSVSEDALYFTACNRPGGLGGCDIYFTRRTAGGWSAPANLGEPINSPYNEVNATIDAAGMALVFASDRPGGLGDYDLWISRRTKNPLAFVPLLPAHFGWGTPRNLGPAVNTTAWEGVGFLHSGGQLLYFSSTGREGLGKADIFKSEDHGGAWGEAENLGEIVNTARDDIYFSIPGAGDVAYFSSDMRGGLGKEDIYSISLPLLVKQRQVCIIRGFVRDKRTQTGVAAKIVFQDPETGADLATAESNPETGGYQIILTQPEADLQVTARNYRPYSEFMTLAAGGGLMVFRDFELEPSGD